MPATHQRSLKRLALRQPSAFTIHCIFVVCDLDLALIERNTVFQRRRIRSARTRLEFAIVSPPAVITQTISRLRVTQTILQTLFAAGTIRACRAGESVGTVAHVIQTYTSVFTFWITNLNRTCDTRPSLFANAFSIITGSVNTTTSWTCLDRAVSTAVSWIAFTSMIYAQTVV